MPAAAAANPFLADTVLTASPERLLVMLYDRLALDLEMGEAAIARRDPSTAHERLTNAQAIVVELHSSLDTAIWPQGTALLAVYDYLVKLLVEANVYKDAARVAEARALVAPLQAAWREAATITARADAS